MKKFVLLNKKILNIYSNKSKKFKQTVLSDELIDIIKESLIIFPRKLLFTKKVIVQFFEKDKGRHKKIQDKELFKIIEKYILNNFDLIISIANIYNIYNWKFKDSNW